MATATDPKARARDAFSDLDTPDKTAFVIEATFSTIGAALRETGERLGDIIRDFDPETFFVAPEPAAPEAKPKARPKTKRKAAAPKTSTAKTAAAKKASAKKPATTKTAGRSRKKTDDDK